MGRIEKTVFISYRRTHGIWGRAIYQELTSHGYDAFYDFQSINSGDFAQIILENIKARAHFVVLLAPSALERCENPNDWLRKEIEIAIDSKRNIIPIMLEGFDFESPEAIKTLTGKLALLKSYNGIRIFNEFFEEGMKRLRDGFLNIELAAVIHPVSDTVQQITREQQKEAKKAKEVNLEELSAQAWLEKGYKATDINEQFRYFNMAISLKTDFADAYLARGAVSAERGDFNSGIDDFNEAIVIDKNHPEAYYNRSMAYYRLRLLDKAIEDSTTAISINPDFDLPYIAKGLALKEKGDIESAIISFTTAIKLNPSNYKTYLNRGDLYRNKNELERSISDYTEALIINQDCGLAYLNRGLVFKDIGNLQGAENDLNNAIKHKVITVDLYLKLGNIYKKERKFEDANNTYTKGINLRSTDLKITLKLFYNRGLVRSIMGARRLAIEDFEEYLKQGGGKIYNDQEEVEMRIINLKNKLT
jgi:tetratricopeptide (TPR) repeat protein